MALQFVDGGQGAGGRLEIHEAVALTAVGGFIKNSLGGNNRTEPDEKKKKIQIKRCNSKQGDFICLWIRN